MSLKPITYGDSMAIMILAAERMGINPCCVDYATKMLKGEPVHPMHGAAVSNEAVRINNSQRHDASWIAQANAHAEKIKAEYGFIPSLPVESDSSKKQDQPVSVQVSFAGDEHNSPFEHQHSVSLADIAAYHNVRLDQETETQRISYIEDYVLYEFYRKHGNDADLRVDVVHCPPDAKERADDTGPAAA